jgi:uncharacterized protein YlxW (UPF0749 family)
MLSWVIFACVLIATACAIVAARLAFVARNAAQQLASSRIAPASLESRISSLGDSLAETQDALTTLANRVKMMKVRNAANHVGESNTIPNDPALLKDYLRKKAGLIAGQPAQHK